MNKFQLISRILKTVFVNPFSTKRSLQRLKERDVSFSTIIEIGASDGRWSETCMKFYPGSQYFLFEAQKEHEQRVMKLKNSCKNVNYIISDTGDKEGKIFFDNATLCGGAASYDMFEKNCVEENGLKPPFFFKLDTHGFEEKIINGAAKTLENTEMLNIEAYVHPINGTLKFFEWCAFLKERGFLLIKMVDLMLRQYDNSLLQMDVFFERKDNKKFKYDE